MWCYRYEEAIGLDHLRLIEVVEPTPEADEIVIRMLAASLNYRDLAIARGHYHAGVSPPLVPLSDGAGRVVACGANVTRFALGDLVCPLYLPDWLDGPITPAKAARRLGGPSDGTYSELLCVREHGAVLAPRHLDAVEAATLPVAALTAWHSLFAQGGLQSGMTVLVHGVGGVASFAIQFAKLAGAKVVVIVAGTERVKSVRDLGADHIVDPADHHCWPSDVRRLAPGGVDRVIDVAGSTLSSSIACCGPEGVVHMVGYSAGTQAPLDLFTAIRHAITLKAASAGHRASFERMVGAMESGGIRPLIGDTFRRAEFPQALAALDRRGRAGKIVLDFF